MIFKMRCGVLMSVFTLMVLYMYAAHGLRCMLNLTSFALTVHAHWVCKDVINGDKDEALSTNIYIGVSGDCIVSRTLCLLTSCAKYMLMEICANIMLLSCILKSA